MATTYRITNILARTGYSRITVLAYLFRIEPTTPSPLIWIGDGGKIVQKIGIATYGLTGHYTFTGVMGDAGPDIRIDLTGLAKIYSDYLAGTHFASPITLGLGRIRAIDVQGIQDGPYTAEQKARIWYFALTKVNPDNGRPQFYPTILNNEIPIYIEESVITNIGDLKVADSAIWALGSSANCATPFSLQLASPVALSI